MTMTVSQTSRSTSAPASACERRRVPSKRKGMVTMPTVSAPTSLASLRDDGRGAGAGAAALAGGDEDHVGAAEHVLDLVLGLLGGATPDVGVGARAEALGQLAADVELDRRLALLQLLDVRVHGDELDLRDPRLDHAVDGVQPRPADADDADDREVGGRVGRGVERMRGAGSIRRRTGCVAWRPPAGSA